MNTKETNKQDSSKGEELVTRKNIKDSPFEIIGTLRENKRVYFGVVGKHRVTEHSDNEKDIEKELGKITWNRIVQVVIILMEANKNIKE